MGQTTADILIIGGGVIGLSVAWHLGRQSDSVTVLDSGEQGQASAVAAGMLAPLAEAGAPGPFLDLALDSLRRYPEFVKTLRVESGTPLEIRGPGMLRVARTDEEESELDRAIIWQSALGLPLRRLTSSEVRTLEPAAAPSLQSAILSPQERHIEPRGLIASLAVACRNRNVQLISGRALGLELPGGEVAAVRTETERLPCKSLVIAGGAWSDLMGQWLGVQMPISPLRGQILALGPVQPAPLRHTLYTHGAYLVPRSDGRIVVGATEEAVGFDSRTTERGIAGLRLQAERLVPCLMDMPLHSAWSGLRPLSADGLPLLGRVPGWDNVFVATGHGRNGILLAPVTGALMADAILKGTPLPAAFDPARFGARP